MSRLTSLQLKPFLHAKAMTEMSVNQTIGTSLSEQKVLCFMIPTIKPAVEENANEHHAHLVQLMLLLLLLPEPALQIYIPSTEALPVAVLKFPLFLQMRAVVAPAAMRP